MNASTRLESYLNELRARIRSLIYMRTAAVAVGGALLLTIVFVAWLAASGYTSSIAWTGRILIGALIVVALGALLWWPLRKLAIADGSQEFERRLPEQRGRIQTYLDIRRREAEVGASPLTDLLAEDAATLAEKTPVETVIPKPHLMIPGAIAAVALLALAFLITVAPGYWGFGSRHLLFGADLPRNAVPVRTITVSPGDAVVRRNSDFSIRATADGFDPETATVYVRFDDEQEWQRAPMQAVSGDDDQRTFQFKLYALRGPLHYYVTAENTKSTEHGVSVADLPRVDKVRLTYSYPKWTGLAPMTEETLRDIRAVAETQVKVEVFSNVPLDAPALVVDGAAAPLDSQGDANVGNIDVKKPGRYHIGARVANEFVALTEDYPIEIVVDEKPTIQIAKPGRDWRATSIEEVPVKVTAQDDFRVQNLELRYAVNGGKWQTVSLGSAEKEIDSDSLLRLEELGAQEAKDAGGMLEPGDVVSYYAVAKDRNKAVQTDLFMVTVQPFERRFTQANGGGGGGGGGAGDEQGAISERQREILLATWNLQRTDQRESRSPEQLKENSKMLAEMQSTLAEQARTVAERTRARMSVDGDERIKAFVESMEKAANTMDPAAKNLREFKLEQAVPIEQQALQQLLRAESAFRDVQVSMERQNGGGGGQQAARNFTEMFELEMDVQKNQYEQQSQLSMENKQQEIDEALRKLKELAARQEKLAEEAQRKAMTQQEQRWRQEQLRREAEDLRRQLAELSRQENGQQQASNQQQQGQQQSGQQSDRQQSGQQSDRQQQGQQQAQQSGQQSNQQQSNDQQGGRQSGQRSESQVQNALNSLQNALDDMRAANQQNGNDDVTRAAREASENLNRALKQMDRPKQGGALDKELEQFADRTQDLSEKQREIESNLNKALGTAQSAGRRRGVIDPRSAAEIAAEKQQMATDLETLQREMRESVHKHRTETPEGARKLGEIVNELESSGISFRINRSAAEVLYGRARDAAPREGLITEGLENLEKDLREAAAFAANDKKQQGTQANPEELLAQIGELRRALEEARREQREQGQQVQRGQGQQGEREGERLAQLDQQNQDRNQQQGSRSDQAGGNSGSDASGQQQQGQSSNGQANARSPSTNIGGGGPNGLSAWDPAANRYGSLPGLEQGIGRLRETRELSERVEQLAERMGRGQMSEAELRALQRMAHELRRLAGNPIATHPEAMAKLVDQLELATLAAAQKANPGAPPRTAVQSADATEYREAVAEYYRRLGGS